MQKLIATVTSRRLWATVAAIAAVISQEGFKAGLGKIVLLVMGYVGSLGLEEAGKAFGTASAANAAPPMPPHLIP